MKRKTVYLQVATVQSLHKIGDTIWVSGKLLKKSTPGIIVSFQKPNVALVRFN